MILHQNDEDMVEMANTRRDISFGSEECGGQREDREAKTHFFIHILTSGHFWACSGREPEAISSRVTVLLTANENFVKRSRLITPLQAKDIADC